MAPEKALIVVDMQEDFCEPKGTLAIPGARELVATINELLDKPDFAVKIATQDWHPKDHVSFVSQHSGGQNTYTITNSNNKEESKIMCVLNPSTETKISPEYL